jgi:hypothetical protein
MTGPARAVVGLAAGLAVLAGVITASRFARQDLDRRGHYAVALSRFDIPTPPGLTKDVFLAEVLYNRPLPPTLDRTDPATRTALQQAFAAHPWVESVTVGDLSDPAGLRVTIRTPALAVAGRAVDRLGALLPLATPTDGLPEYRGPVADKATPSGQPHPDPRVVAVARTVGWLKAQAPDLKWQAAELTPDGLVLTRPDGRRATWGFSKPTEPPADAKLARLREWSAGDINLTTR